jgi:hypothetical protein
MLTWIPTHDLLAIYGSLVTAYHTGSSYRLDAALIGDGSGRDGFCETEDRSAWFRACYVHALVVEFQYHYPEARVAVNGRPAGTWIRHSRFTDKYWTISIGTERDQFGVLESSLEGPDRTGPDA